MAELLAGLSATLSQLSAPLTLAGGAVSAIGTIQAGQAAKEAAEFQAAQLEQQAQEARAAAQRQALERRRQAALALSQIQARSAAGGSDATSADILRLSEDVAGRGEYQALADMYSGENRARGLEDKATAARLEGAAKAQGAIFSGLGTLLSTGGSAYDKGNKLFGISELLKPKGSNSLFKSYG